MKISQIMKKERLVFDAGDTLAYAMKRMAAMGRSEAPVIKQRKFAGMIYASKIASLLVKRNIVGRPILASVKGIQDKSVAAYAEPGMMWPAKEDDVLRSFILLSKKGMNTIPVLDKGRRLVGVVHASDLHKEMARMLSAGGKPAVRAKAVEDDNESARGKTAIDGIVSYVKKKGPVSSEEVAKGCGLTVSEVEEYATSLEKNGFLKLEYSIFGKMKLKAPE